MRIQNHEGKAVRLLNLVVGLDGMGIHVEGDQRHTDILVDRLGLKDARAVVTPGEKAKNEEEEDELAGQKAILFGTLREPTSCARTVPTYNSPWKS